MYFQNVILHCNYISIYVCTYAAQDVRIQNGWYVINMQNLYLCSIFDCLNSILEHTLDVYFLEPIIVWQSILHQQTHLTPKCKLELDLSVSHLTCGPGFDLASILPSPCSFIFLVFYPTYAIPAGSGLPDVVVDDFLSSTAGHKAQPFE